MIHFDMGTFSRDTFALALVEAKEQLNCPMHVHGFSELVIVRGGRGLHRVGALEYDISAGDIFVVEGDTAHAYQDVRGLTLSNLLFRFRELALPWTELSALPGFHALFRVEPRLRGDHEFRSRLRVNARRLLAVDLLLERMRPELRHRYPGYRAVATALFAELIVTLARWYAEESITRETRMVARLGRIASRMESDYAGAITLRGLAAEAHLSERSLLRYFRGVFGMSPIAYLQNVRLNRAKELLTQSDIPVKEISRRVGIDNPNFFARHFKGHTGLSPTAFRRLNATAAPGQDDGPAR